MKIEVGVGVLEMAEDAGEHAPEQAMAPLFNKLASSLVTTLQARHHVGEEAEMAGVIGRAGMRGVLIADVAQCRVGPVPEALKHGGVHALQCPPLEHFLPVLPRNGLGVIDPLLKREQLGAGGVQFRLRRDQGGCGGLLALLHLS